MDYIGEHSFYGQLGHTLIILSFVFAAVSAVSYFFGAREADSSWRKWGRISFYLHSISALGAIGTLFYMFDQQMIEYEYIHSHTNSTMPKKFIMVAFWGGQQGSLLLWTFWHVVLGNILIHLSRKWEYHVMTVFAAVQVFVISCLLGVYIGDWKIGESPFLLWRETKMGLAPLWNRVPDYLEFDPMFKDGTGLNLTLMNYWMTIHPPTLFLGFSATLIPFCYAIAGLWQKKFVEWIKPALPWALFAGGILGLGILMGGAWAYESLTFGGFWAWDPVENASLVPWLVLIGAIHTMIVAQKRGTAVFTSYLLTATSFIFILLSTFLTRSGILGDTSVHSFTDNGMLTQLLLFIVVFTWLSVTMVLQTRRLRSQFIGIGVVVFLLSLIPGAGTPFIADVITLNAIIGTIGFSSIFIYLFLGYQKGFPKPNKEEELWSREFWMFIGSLVLVASSAQIIFNTSIPAFNELFNTNMAPPSDEKRVAFYNNWQIPFATIITLLMGVGQYFKYRKSPIQEVGRKLLIPVLITTMIVFAVLWRFDFGPDEGSMMALAIASSFAIGANLDYWIRMTKGKLNFAGSSIAHIGFALILIGTVLSQGKQEIISQNSSGHLLTEMRESMSNKKEALVYRGDTSLINNYFVSFTDKKIEGENIHFRMEFFKPIPNRYTVGDTVRFMSSQGTVIFKAIQDHQASDHLQQDINRNVWTGISMDSLGPEYFTLPWWEPYTPGEKLFELAPFVQTEPGQANNKLSIEPGTKHFVDRDVFTYLKLAELGPSEKEGKSYYMTPDNLNRPVHVNSTEALSRFLFRFEDVFAIPDSLKDEYYLLPGDSAIGVRIRAHEVRHGFLDMNSVTQDLLYIIRDGEQIPDEIHSDQLGFKLQMKGMHVPIDTVWEFRSEEHTLTLRDTILPDSLKSIEDSRLVMKKVPDFSKASFNLAFSEKEYIVFQAIIFPYINILWTGCIIMVIGTLLAMMARIRKKES